LNKIKESFIYIQKNKIVFILLLSSFLLSVSTCLRGFKLVWVILFTDLGLSAVIIGLINSVSAIGGIFLPYTSKYFSKLIKSESKLIATMFFIQILALFSIFFVNDYISAIILFLIIYIIIDIISPIRNYFFQKQVNSKIRATLTSTENMFKSIAYIIGVPLAAYFIETVGVNLTFVFSGVILIPFVILLYKLKNN